MIKENSCVICLGLFEDKVLEDVLKQVRLPRLFLLISIQTLIFLNFVTDFEGNKQNQL